MGKNVLIVEDDADTREIFRVLLASLKFEAKAAASRDEALHIINSGFEPSCILMDYVMPGMPLQEFLTQAKQFKSQIILTSGCHDAKFAAELASIGCSLQKPIPDAVLAKVIETMAASGNTEEK